MQSITNPAIANDLIDSDDRITNTVLIDSVTHLYGLPRRVEIDEIPGGICWEAHYHNGLRIELFNNGYAVVTVRFFDDLMFDCASDELREGHLNTIVGWVAESSN